MSSRAAILSAIDKAGLPDVSMPVRFAPPESPATGERFSAMLESIGGKLTLCPDPQLDIPSFLSNHPVAGPLLKKSPDRVFLADSLKVPRGRTHPDAESVEPKEFLLAVLRGEFCVAECGAVWVRPSSLRARLAMVSTEHLLLIVPSVIVPSLHEAYAQVDLSGGKGGYFVSGPSKTADIEQTLVIGAQGARTLEVVMTGYSRFNQ